MRVGVCCQQDTDQLSDICDTDAFAQMPKRPIWIKRAIWTGGDLIWIDAVPEQNWSIWIELRSGSLKPDLDLS